MKTQDTGIVFLGRRWSRSAPLPEPAGRRAALDYYAEHRSFPAPPSPQSNSGSGVLVVDTSDFSAVQAAHAYRGDWLVIAFMPDVCARQEDYEVRLVTETLIYGGLRDLELAAVAGQDGIKCVFVVDTPGREYPEPILHDLAGAILSLRDVWDQEPLRPSPWPAVCRGLSMWIDEGDDVGSDQASSDDGEGWVRCIPPSTGEPPPLGIQVVSREPRMLTSRTPLFFQDQRRWLAIGRSQGLSDFLVSRVYYQSARNVLNEPDSAWPEPGDPSLGPRRRYLETLTSSPKNKGKGPEGYLQQLEGMTNRLQAPLPPETPVYVRRWLGFDDERDG